MNLNFSVHQFSAGFQLGDAISQEMMEIKKLLQSNGWKGKLFSGNVYKAEGNYAEKFTKAKISDKDVLIYHHSIHTEVLPYLLKLPNRKILIYHNVTPHGFFEPYDLKFTYLLREGRNDLSIIKEKFNKYFAVSNFNRSELVDLGFENPKLLPLHINFKKWKDISHEKHKKDPIQFLFVGRIAPNKRQDDLIRFAKIWKSFSEKPFSMKIVGFCNPNQQTYLDELEMMIRTYELKEEVQIVPYVNEAILSKFYQESSYFLSMSEHEGFCVPLLEAMLFQLPVIAFDAGAVAETMDGAGVLFRTKNFKEIINMILELESNPDKKESVLLKQSQRLESYSSRTDIKLLLNSLEEHARSL
nr:glycosyltransferase family 4 protein [Leptospira idonii]